MNCLLDFDEINRFELDLAQSITNNSKRTDELLDEILDYFLYCYALGVRQANADLNTDIEIDEDKANDAVWKRTDGEDFADRLYEYITAQDFPAINKVIETEAHRIYETGAVETAIIADRLIKKSGSSVLDPDAVDEFIEIDAVFGTSVVKCWNTMRDDRVRDAHQYLNGVEVDIDADFFTYDGDHAPAPGLFESAALNINCRCYLTFRRV